MRGNPRASAGSVIVYLEAGSASESLPPSIDCKERPLLVVQTLPVCPDVHTPFHQAVDDVDSAMRHATSCMFLRLLLRAFPPWTSSHDDRGRDMHWLLRASASWRNVMPALYARTQAQSNLS